MDTNKDTASKKMLQEALLDNKDVLREKVRDFCQNLLEEEMEAHLGAKKYQRNEKALVVALMEAYLAGVSTRKVKKLTEALCGTSFSAATISAITSKLDSQIATWKVRKLNKAYPYLIVDATYIKVRIEDTVMFFISKFNIKLDSSILLFNLSLNLRIS